MRHELIEYIDHDRNRIIAPDKKLEDFRVRVREEYPDINKKKAPRVIYLDDYKPYYKPNSPLRVIKRDVKRKGIPKPLPPLSKRKSPSLDELVAILKDLKK
jgi:hypothetical protein